MRSIRSTRRFQESCKCNAKAADVPGVFAAEADIIGMIARHPDTTVLFRHPDRNPLESI